MASTIYIDHAEADAAWAGQLAALLRAHDLHVSIRDEVVSGDSNFDALERNLNASARIILVVTPQSMADPQTQLAWKAHVSRPGVACIPLILRATPLPVLLRSYKPLAPDWDSPTSLHDAAKRLLGDLGAPLGKHESPTLPPRPEQAIPDGIWLRLVAAFAPMARSADLAAILRADLRALGHDVPDEAPAFDEAPEQAANAYLARFLDAPDPVHPLLAALNRRRETLAALKGSTDEALTGLVAALEGLAAAPQAASLRQRYLEALIARLEREPLALSQLRRLRIEDVFVALETAHADCERTPYEIEYAEALRAANRPLTLDSQLEHPKCRRWSLLGEPGSGKTTLLKHTALVRARRLSVAPSTETPPQASLPLYLSVTALVASKGDPFAAIDAETALHGYPPGCGTWLHKAAESGQVLLLLDGLDEVPTADRTAMRDALQTLSNREPIFTAGCHMVVSSRFFGYDDHHGLFAELRLLPLDDSAQLRLLTKCLPDDPGRVAELRAAIAKERTLRDIAGNPFLLTLMALPAATRPGDQVEAPPARRRSEVLSRAIDYLLRGAPRHRPGDPADHPVRRHELLVRPVLARLALRLLEQSAGPYKLQAIHPLLTEDPEWQRLGDLYPPWKLAETFVKDIASYSELLVKVDELGHHYRFAHRSLQESLAAHALALAGESTWGPRAGAVGDNQDQLGQWAETFALLAGEVDGADALLTSLMRHNSDLGLRALASASGEVSETTMLALLALESGGDKWEGRMKVLLELRERLGSSKHLVDLLDRLRQKTSHGADLFFIREFLEGVALDGTDRPARSAAADALTQLFAHLDDPPLLHETPVTLADGSSADFWCPVTGLPGLDAIGRVPVTNALYEQFLPAHRDDRAFTKGVAADELANHPVVNVTWFEAETFCRWLAQKNLGVVLPSEEQWEFAATRGDGRKFPWPKGTKGSPDATRANFGEKVGHTTAVGRYPEGAGPFGTLDQAGNVWEWASDRRDNTSDPIVHNVDKAAFALRGGSWSNSAGDLAAAYRRWYQGWNRLRIIGFRCALSSSSPSTVR